MRQALGLVFIVASIWLLVYGFVWISNFSVQPELFPLYQMLAELPAEERIIKAANGELELPVGLFKVSGLAIAALFLFVALSIIKMFFNAGVTLLAPKVEDTLDKMLKKLKESNAPTSRGIEQHSQEQQLNLAVIRLAPIIESTTIATTHTGGGLSVNIHWPVHNAGIVTPVLKTSSSIK